MEIRTVHANGVEFAYLAVGEGPLALCLHGFPDTAHTWRHLLPALAERGYRAVAPFLRGYAPTEIPADGAYEAGALVADVRALHEELGGDSAAVLIGHDWGAFPVYATADRFRRSVAMAVPPAAALATGRGRGWLDAACVPTVRRMPAMVSTFPLRPFGSLGVFTGSATIEPEDVL